MKLLLNFTFLVTLEYDINCLKSPKCIEGIFLQGAWVFLLKRPLTYVTVLKSCGVWRQNRLRFVNATATYAAFTLI